MIPNRPFLLRPANRAFLRGDTHRLAGFAPMGSIAFPVMGVILALVCFAAAYHARQSAAALKLRQVVAIGTVLDRRIGTSVGMVDVETGMVHSEDEFLVRYRFEVAVPAGRRVLEREGSVSETAYAELVAGKPVAVIYDRDDPETSRLVSEGDPNLDRVLIAGGAVTLLISLAGGGLLMANILHGRRLARDGTLVEGRILGCTSNKNDENVLQIVFAYTFTTPGGQIVRDSATALRDGSIETPLPEVGEALAVLYLDKSAYEVL
jgi:hypothetical protein